MLKKYKPKYVKYVFREIYIYFLFFRPCKFSPQILEKYSLEKL